MKSTRITVTSGGLGMRDALDMTEKLGAESGLGEKENLHLRLLAEELFGMLRSIAGDVEAGYWLEFEKKAFELHMDAYITLTQEMRQQLLDVSTTGKNAAAKGLMGKIRDMIALKLLPTEEGPSDLALALMNVAWSSPTGNRIGNVAAEWSMNQYKSEVKSSGAQGADVEAARDELEKSIVANVADEVRIGIVGSNVEITIFKAF